MGRGSDTLERARGTHAGRGSNSRKRVLSLASGFWLEVVGLSPPGSVGFYFTYLEWAKRKKLYSPRLFAM